MMASFVCEAYCVLCVLFLSAVSGGMFYADGDDECLKQQDTCQTCPADYFTTKIMYGLAKVRSFVLCSLFVAFV